MDHANSALAPRYRRSGPFRPRRISLNDQPLDEIETLVEGETSSNTVKTVKFEFAMREIRVFDDGADAVVLRIPSRLALTLYHEGILTYERGRSVDVKVDGKSKSSFRIDWQRQVAKRIRQPESVLLRLVREGAMPN